MTRHHAKTFSFASHVLPAQKRSDAYAVYAFCRHVDDQIDLAPDEPARLRALADLSRLLHAAWLPGEGAESFEHSLPWLRAFRETIRRRAIPSRYFEDLLKGVEMDRGRVRLRTWDELDNYCYHVASVVGLIMVHVLTEPAPELLKPARDLGTAMQLTNILRDIAEDWRRDRLYLPADELEKFGLTAEDIAQQRTGESFRAMMRFQIDRARDYYRRAEPGIAALPADGSRFCARLMSTVYGAILDEIERADYQVYRGRVRVSFLRKLGLALKCGIGRSLS
ncbi:MAG TPA: phytoene/squalene synthase family protein [Candidatus Methylacidiphilales bacterium]|jgi:phytoene synthase|nr:phytoene/squalene synthase family protein [Candidatus Methylacidiphilales bacterium]